MSLQTIFFDIGSTLRGTEKTAEFTANAKVELAALAQSSEAPELFYEKLKGRYDAFREASKITGLDYPEIEFWTQVMLPDGDLEYVAAHAPRLTWLWRDAVGGRRITQPGAVETVKELYRRGYTLGVIANTITETEIPDWMMEEGISHCFTTTILSSKVRLRKPDPAIYHLASRCCGTPEAQCVYVGDNPDRDVEGTRAAGYGCMILIDVPKKNYGERAKAACDHYIYNLKDLLELFPAKN